MYDFVVKTTCHQNFGHKSRLPIFISTTRKMVLGCGAKVLKYCLFAFNLLFFIAGVVCLCLGIYLIGHKHSWDKVMIAVEQEGQTLENRSNAIYYLGIFTSVAGAVILVIAFLGCCGSVKEWRPMLILYAICLMVILAVEIAIAIYAAANRNSIGDVAKKSLLETLKFYGGTYKKKNAVRAAWDIIMTKHQCCGVNSTTSNEFANSEWFKKIFGVRYQATDQSSYYPGDCCLDPNHKIAIPNAGTQDDLVCKDRTDQGCFSKIVESIQSRLAIVIGVGVAVTLIQLIGLIFALCLCRAISEGD